jgi:hypothetical protein
MRVIHRVPDKFTIRSRQAHDTFTTKNRSRWISFNFVRDSFTTDSYSILVREGKARQGKGAQMNHEFIHMQTDFAQKCHILALPSSERFKT